MNSKRHRRVNLEELARQCKTLRGQAAGKREEAPDNRKRYYPKAPSECEDEDVEYK